MTDSLAVWQARGVLTPLDLHFARAAGEIGGDQRPLVLLGAALTSRATREGHVFLDLSRVAGSRVVTPDGTALDLYWPGLSRWVLDLASSPLCSHDGRATPLVLTGDRRLYLARYHAHEVRLGELISARLEGLDQPLLPEVLRRTTQRLFPETPGQSCRNWQRAAVEIAALRRLLVLAGGPGTGKTFTVARLIALLGEHAQALGGSGLRVLLLAPTGKAAARLSESVRVGRTHGIGAPGTQPAPVAATIHRAIGYHGGNRPPHRHAGRPLAADLVVVDEASMVDLGLMRRLVEAVPEQARMVLVGDPYQLASVEAGAVFGDLCGPEGPSAYSEKLVSRVEQVFGESLPRATEPVAPITDSVVRLLESRRFGQESAIGALARSIQSGDPEQVLQCLRTAPPDELVHALPRGERGLGPWLAPLAVEGYRPSLGASNAAEALRAFGEFRVLCAHRSGPHGVDTLNALIERALARRGLIDPRDPFYRGRPVLVTENDYQLDLFNGDVGIAWPEVTGMRVVFLDTEGRPRPLIPARVPPHETVFAMSIHKSQGSEFDEVVVVLPDEASPLLTRELFYTAISRARSRLIVYATADAIRAAVTRTAQRSSGLGASLWG